MGNYLTLRYARFVGISIDVLLDDILDLPTPQGLHVGIKVSSISRTLLGRETEE